MQHMVIITMMLPQYSKEIVYQFIRADFEVCSAMAKKQPPHTPSNGRASVIMSLFLDDKDVDDSRTMVEIVQDILQKASAKYYSAIIQTQGQLRLIEGNIFIKEKAVAPPKPKSNILKLIPKPPAKLEAPPDNIVE